MQEEPGQSHNWLLPLTRPIDPPAWDAILHMAEGGRAAIVAVSLTVRPAFQTPSAYQEELRSKQTSLAELRLKARTYAVPLEWYEESPTNGLARIIAMTREFQCNGMLLGSWKGQRFFLTREIVRALLISPPARLVMLRLPGQRGVQTRPEQGSTRLFWLRKLVRQTGDLFPPTALTRHARMPQGAKLITGEQKRSHEPCSEHAFYW